MSFFTVHCRKIVSVPVEIKSVRESKKEGNMDRERGGGGDCMHYTFNTMSKFQLLDGVVQLAGKSEL